MGSKPASSQYWWDKLRHADYLANEKEAQAQRLMHEAKLLRKRRERIAKSWKSAVDREAREREKDDTEQAGVPRRDDTRTGTEWDGELSRQ